MIQLFPYQREGAQFLALRGRALLADEPGLGKTAQAIVAAASPEYRTGTVIVVVCPASVRENWIREFKQFWPHPQVPPALLVESYDKVARGAFDHVASHVLILDEAHYLKNPDAKRTKAIFGVKCDGVGGLVERADRVFCLTGTPAPNNPAELWPMLRAVMPDAITPRDVEGTAAGKPMSYWQFVNRYCVTRDNGYGIEIVKGKNLDKLKARIEPFVLRRKKADVLSEIPPIRFSELVLSPSGAASALRKLESGDEAARIAGALEKGESLESIAPHVAAYRRAVGLAKVGPVVEWCKEWFDAHGGKLVLFAYHRDVIASLVIELDKLGLNPVAVQGETIAEARQRNIDDFQNNPNNKVFVGQITAAGTGITLTASSRMIFVECSWTPSDNQQAAMRIHRIGQKNACLVQVATLAGSIDERIQAACLRKLTDIKKLFN